MLKLLAQYLQCFFLNPGDIAAGDIQRLGNLPLGHRFAAEQAIPHDDGLLLPRG